MSDEEKQKIKTLFYQNEALLLAVRNLFFGFELTAEEKASIQSNFSTPESRRLMRKIFLPELQRDIPIGQNIDLWMTVQFENKDEKEQGAAMESRTILLTALNRALQLLENTDGKRVDLGEWDGPTGLTARNTFIQHVEMQLQVIKVLANTEELTPEEAVDRLRKDSTK